MSPDFVSRVQEAVADLRRRGAVQVPQRLASWVRQSAEERGWRVRTTPVWAGDVRIEVVEVAADVVRGG